MKEMMIFKAILFSQCVLHVIGRNPHGEDSEGPLSWDRSWETQNFINGDSHLEQESENHFSALRERRDATKPQDEEIFSTSGDNPCDLGLDDCHQNAICFHQNATINYTKSFTCTCKNGFTGDGKTCEDIDECEEADNQCSQNARCNNTLGSFQCTCKEIYYGDGKVCKELRSDYSSKNVYTKPGESAVLVCSLNETVQWKKDGKLIVNNGRRKISKNVLVINSKDDDYGEYFCELQNYKGKGLKMSLLKINENEKGNDDSAMFLIPFIIVLVLLVVALAVIVYLLLKRKPKLDTTIKRNPTASDNPFSRNNEIFMRHIDSVSNVDVIEEPGYATYKPPTTADQENTYQSLVDVDKSPAKIDPDDDYEDVPPARKD